MKRITEYRKIFDLTPTSDLATLKKNYKTLMKQWHPDKFTEDEEKREEAEAKSKTLIQAYQFLISIAPETHAAFEEDYTQTITQSRIDDFTFKGQTLKVTFSDGSSYEYFGVTSNVYNKFMNSSTPLRFGRRHIFTSYIRRNVSKQMAKEPVTA